LKKLSTQMMLAMFAGWSVSFTVSNADVCPASFRQEDGSYVLVRTTSEGDVPVTPSRLVAWLRSNGEPSLREHRIEVPPDYRYGETADDPWFLILVEEN
jgi:hypothetical protein